MIELSEQAFLDKIGELEDPAEVTENFQIGRYLLRLVGSEVVYASPEIYPMSVQDAERLINLIEVAISRKHRLITRHSYSKAHPWEIR